MPGIVSCVNGLFMSLCQTQCPAKETLWWLLSFGVIIPHGQHRLGDANWHMALLLHHPGMGDLRKIFGHWVWDVVAESHPAPEQEKPGSPSRAR